MATVIENMLLRDSQRAARRARLRCSDAQGRYELTESQKKQVRYLLDQGLTTGQIAKRCGLLKELVEKSKL